MSKVAEKRIGVTAFKAKCLSLVDEVAQGRTGRVVLTKRGRPVAEVVRAARDEPAGAYDPWGALRDLVHIHPDVDLTEPSGDV